MTKTGKDEYIARLLKIVPAHLAETGRNRDVCAELSGAFRQVKEHIEGKRKLMTAKQL